MALAGAPTIVLKEFREHGLPMLLLAAGFLATLMLAHAQNQKAVFSMSPLEILLLSITLVLPLIAFIMGGRLVTTEYLGHTRQFVEALPIKSWVFISIKYSLGLLYLLGLALAAIAYAWVLSDSGDALDKNLLRIVAIKTLSVVFFVWSVVFCFSFFGYLRFALYVALGLVVTTLIAYPEFNEKVFGPFALLDSGVFAFERDELPVKAVLQTLGMGLVFTVGGFLLPLLREGSLLEALSKPVSRGNLVVLGVIGVGVFATLGALFERWEKDEYQFSSDHVVSQADPPITILYQEPQYLSKSQALLDTIAAQIISLQSELDLEALPVVRIVLDKDLSADNVNDVRFSNADGVLLRANYLSYDSYSMAVFNTNVIHQLIQSVSGSRRTFEPYHWVLDGFSRWWVEGNLSNEQHEYELYARALYGLNYLDSPVDLSGNWQWIADVVNYPTAEALAFTAFHYFEQEYGRDKLLELANLVLAPTVGDSAVGMVKDRLVGMKKPFVQLTGDSLATFFYNWQQWLEREKTDTVLSELLSKLPIVNTTVSAQLDENGVQRLVGNYHSEKDKALLDAATCSMQHVLVSPFDYEISYNAGELDEQPCNKNSPVHDVSSYYASGDRVFVAFEFKVESFTQPLRVGAYRVEIE